MNRTIFSLVAVAATVLLISASAPAALISADIHQGFRATVRSTSGDHTIGDINAAGQNATDDQIGVWDNGASAVNWWNYGDFSATNLSDADGNVTTVGYATTATGSSNAQTAGLPNDDLVSDVVYMGGTVTFTTTISGLVEDGVYDLLVYHADNNISETVTVNGVSASDYTGSLAHPNYADAFDGLTDSDFWYFSQVQVNASEELVISTGGSGSFNTLAGFQLQQVILIPAPAALPAGVGLLALIFLRRRRGA